MRNRNEFASVGLVYQLILVWSSILSLSSTCRLSLRSKYSLTLNIGYHALPTTEAVLLWLLCWGGVAQACSILLTGEAPQVRHTQRVISWSMAERFQLTQTGWKGQNFALDIGTWKPDFACTWSCSNLTLKSIAWAKSIGKVRLWETGKLRISWEWHR